MKPMKFFNRYASVQPFLYFVRISWPCLLRTLYFNIFQIWASYWSSVGRSKVSVEVKSIGRSTEKVELMRTLFNWEELLFRKNIFDHRKKPSKFKYINFRDLLHLL